MHVGRSTNQPIPSISPNPPPTQLRIHTTEACDLYVHTVSGPIIEDCDALRFAPYALRYAGLDGDMAVGGSFCGCGRVVIHAAQPGDQIMADHTHTYTPAAHDIHPNNNNQPPQYQKTQAAQLTGTRNAWGEVKDFKWLRAQQSPHWSVLPEGERRAEEAVEAVVVGGRGGEEEEEI